LSGIEDSNARPWQRFIYVECGAGKSNVAHWFFEASSRRLDGSFRRSLWLSHLVYDRTEMLNGLNICMIPACRDAWSGTPWPPRSPVTAAPLNVVLGRRLRRLRIERGWSTRTVADRLGLPVDHVEEHEGGVRRIEAGELVAYVKLYDVTIAELFRDLPADGNSQS
jgi:hypothetical protein